MKHLELIHGELCVPIQASAGGSKYLLVSINDFSRYYVSYLLKEKSETTSALQMYAASMTNKFSRKPHSEVGPRW